MPMTPAATSGLRWEPITPEHLPAWTDLVTHLATVDGTEEFYREADLAEELASSSVDPREDTVGVWDGDRMVAFGQVTVPLHPDHEGNGRGYVGGGVREEHRGQGLGRTLMDLLEPRAEALVRERHPSARTAYLRASGGLGGSSAELLLRHRGYRVVRYYNELTRDLTGTVEVPAVEGITLLPPGPEHEEVTRLAHNDAFRDHWGSGPQAESSWREFWTGRSRRPALSTLAVDGTGRVLAYVLCSEWVDRELYVDLLGTVRDARGRGLARAALLRTIERAGAAGEHDLIELGVDSQNPSGATHLYEQVGFVHKLQTTSLQRDLRGPGGGDA